ncbi:MAG: hypothetical protein JWR80_9476 [Bradyrhizobium sp.]|nr:hypothetical protein [Bradyrhizobium sp.]
MARGGAREGAGRKKGGHNRITEEAIEQARSDGVMPLDYMLSIMRDVKADESKRIDCAKAAAPYLHPKLSQVEAKIDSDVTHHEGSLPEALLFLARYGGEGKG